MDQLERLTHHPAGTLRDVTKLQAMALQPDILAPWLEAALKNQPLLKQAQATLKLSEQQVQFAKRSCWPTLSMSGVGQHAGGYPRSTSGHQPSWGSLNLSIPIYEGGSIRAGVHQAEALSRASQASVSNLRDQIKLDTQTAFLELQNSVAQFQATQQSVASAKVSLDGTRKGYEIGSRSIIDLMTATASYASAQRNYYLALYTQLVARTQLKAAAGVLTPLDIEALNTLLNSTP